MNKILFVPPLPLPLFVCFCVCVVFCFPRFLSWWTVPVPISKLKGKYIQNQCTLLSPPHPPSHPCLPPSLPRTSHTPALQGPPPSIPLAPLVLAFPPIPKPLLEPEALSPGPTCRVVLQRVLRHQATSASSIPLGSPCPTPHLLCPSKTTQQWGQGWMPLHHLLPSSARA